MKTESTPHHPDGVRQMVLDLIDQADSIKSAAYDILKRFDDSPAERKPVYFGVFSSQMIQDVTFDHEDTRFTFSLAHANPLKKVRLRIFLDEWNEGDPLP